MEGTGAGSGRWKTAFVLGVAAMAVTALYWLRIVALLLFLALLLGILLDSIAWLGIRFLRLPRGGAVVLAAIVFLIALAAGLALIVVPLVKEGTELLESMPATISRMDHRIEQYRREFPWVNRIWPAKGSSAQSGPGTPVPQLAKKALFTASATLESAAKAVAVFFLGLFLAWDPKRWLRGVAELWPGPSVDQRMELFRKMGSGLRRYLFTLAIYIVAMGAAWTLGLWIIGIQYPILFGAIGGMAELVPYVGPMLGLIPPLITAIMVGPAKVLYVILLYAVLHVVEGYILVPYAMHKGLHLPPPVIILSILVFGTLFGVLGVILAVPLGTAIYVWLNETVYAARRAATSD